MKYERSLYERLKNTQKNSLYTKDMQEITYEKFIQNILDTRGRFNCGDKYHERHHIVPKSCGGTNDEDNLIDLFAREHFIAHKLLAEENPDNYKLIAAWWRMCNWQDRNKEFYEPTPEEYEDARIAFSVAHSKAMSGENHPNYGKTGDMAVNLGKHFSDEHRKKIGEAHKGKIVSKETREKLSQANKGRKRSIEERRNQSELAKKLWKDEEYRVKQIERSIGDKNHFYGKKHTEETKKIISEQQKELWKNEEYRKKHSGENAASYGKTRGKSILAKQIIRLYDNKIYECAIDGAEDNNMKYTTFLYKCHKDNGFMFYDKWLLKQNTNKEEIHEI